MFIKKIGFFIIIIFCLFTINDLVRSIYNLWQKNDLVINSQQALDKEKKKNAELRERYSTVKKPEFIEAEARNKLFMARPGEDIIVVAPTDFLEASSSSVQKNADSRTNWQKWKDLFF